MWSLLLPLRPTSELEPRPTGRQAGEEGREWLCGYALAPACRQWNMGRACWRSVARGVMRIGCGRLRAVPSDEAKLLGCAGLLASDAESSSTEPWFHSRRQSGSLWS